MELTHKRDRRAIANVVVAAILALVGGAIIATACLVMPLAPVEAAIRSTGLAELLPAVSPPLGNAARIVMAASAGLVIAVLIYMLLPRKGLSRKNSTKRSDGVTHSGWPRIPRFGSKSSDSDDASDFDDVLNSERHPDAPPRRPIFAHSELSSPDEDEDQPPADMVLTAASEASYGMELSEPVLTLSDDDMADEQVTIDTAIIEAAKPANDAEDAEKVDMAYRQEAKAAGLNNSHPADMPTVAAPAQSDKVPAAAASTVDNSLERRACRRAELASLELGELVDRLEAGMKRRDAAHAAAIDERHAEQQMAGDSDWPEETVEQQGDDSPGEDPQFVEPRRRGDDLDGALSAALETLRQMADRQRNAS